MRRPTKRQTLRFTGNYNNNVLRYNCQPRATGFQSDVLPVITLHYVEMRFALPWAAWWCSVRYGGWVVDRLLSFACVERLHAYFFVWPFPTADTLGPGNIRVYL